MASRIDGDTHPAAHGVIQAMIVRAQRHADRTGKSVGLIYDLGKDVVSLVDLSTINLDELNSQGPLAPKFFRVVAPMADAAGAQRAALRAAECR